MDGGAERRVRSMRAATVSAWVSHALAWAAGVFLAFVPVYQGASVEATLPGEPAGETTRVSSTLVEVNDLSALWWLLVPIVLTGIAVLALEFIENRQAARKALLWLPVVLLLGLCVVGIFSIFFFYLPAVLALLVAAIADFRGRRSPVKT